MRLSNHSLLIVNDLTRYLVTLTVLRLPHATNQDAMTEMIAILLEQALTVSTLQSGCGFISLSHKTFLFFYFILGGREMGDTTDSWHFSSRINLYLTINSTF